MRKVGIILSVLYLWLFQLMAQSPDGQLLLGNQQYTRRAYDSCYVTYGQLLSAGYSSIELYYNAGNCCYKLNKIPEAILFYEKALKLSPDDSDIKFNLEIANARITDKIEKLPELPFSGVKTGLLNMYSADGWAIMCIIMMFWTFISLAMFLFLNSLLLKKLGFYGMLTGIILGTIFFIAANSRYHDETKSSNAIVFSPSVTVKSSPETSGTDLFVIHEGLKVKILEDVGNWYKISLSDGNIGWLLKIDVREI